MELATAREAIKKAGGTVTSKQALEAGLRWEDLYELRDRGDLLELSRGVYRLKEARTTSYLDYLAVIKRVPHAVVCLVSALVYWDLTDEIPRRVHIAVQRGRWRPTISYPPTQVHVFAADTFHLGRELVLLDSGDHIPMYSAERTVVDMFRLRGKMGEDLAIQALRSYLGRRGSSPSKVLQCSRKLRCEKVVADSLKVLMS